MLSRLLLSILSKDFNFNISQQSLADWLPLHTQIKFVVYRDIELFQIFFIELKTVDVYSKEVSTILRIRIRRAAIYVTILTEILT